MACHCHVRHAGHNKTTPRVLLPLHHARPQYTYQVVLRSASFATCFSRFFVLALDFGPMMPPPQLTRAPSLYVCRNVSIWRTGQTAGQSMCPSCDGIVSPVGGEISAPARFQLYPDQRSTQGLALEWQWGLTQAGCSPASRTPAGPRSSRWSAPEPWLFSGGPPARGAPCPARGRQSPQSRLSTVGYRFGSGSESIGPERGAATIRRAPDRDLCHQSCHVPAYAR